MSDHSDDEMTEQAKVYYDRLGDTKSETYARRLIASLETAFNLDSNYERNYSLSSEALMGGKELGDIYGNFETLLLDEGILNRQKGETLPIIKHIFNFETNKRVPVKYVGPETHEIVEEQFISKVHFIAGFKTLISKLYFEYEKNIEAVIGILEKFLISKNEEKRQYKEAIRQQKKDDRKAYRRNLEKKIEEIEERNRRRAERGPTLREIVEKIGKYFAIKETTRTGKYFAHDGLFFRDDDFRPRLDIQKYITLLSKLFGRVISDIRINDVYKEKKEQDLNNKYFALLRVVAEPTTDPTTDSTIASTTDSIRWKLKEDYKYGILPNELYTIFITVLGEYKLDSDSGRLRTKLFNRYYEVMEESIERANTRYDEIVDNEMKMREMLGGQRGGRRKNTFRKKKPLKKSGKTKRSKKNRKTNKKK